MSELVEVTTVRDGVGQILLSAPPRNMGTAALLEQVESGMQELEARGSRVVVIGSGLAGYFLAHGDLEDNLAFFGGDQTSGDFLAWPRVIERLDTGPMVTIAAVEGQAWGGGAEFAWACDLRVASEDASFAQPEVNLGVTPGAGGVAKLVRLAGEAAALALVLDGRPIDGARAHRLGLVHRLVAPGETINAARAWADWLADRPPEGLLACKEVIKSVRDLDFNDARRREVEIYRQTFGTKAARNRARDAIAHYEAGHDSHAAFGVPSK